MRAKIPIPSICPRAKYLSVRAALFTPLLPFSFPSVAVPGMSDGIPSAEFISRPSLSAGCLIRRAKCDQYLAYCSFLPPSSLEHKSLQRLKLRQILSGYICTILNHTSVEDSDPGWSCLLANTSNIASFNSSSCPSRGVRPTMRAKQCDHGDAASQNHRRGWIDQWTGQGEGGGTARPSAKSRHGDLAQNSDDQAHESQVPSTSSLYIHSDRFPPSNACPRANFVEQHACLHSNISELHRKIFRTTAFPASLFEPSTSPHDVFFGGHVNDFAMGVTHAPLAWPSAPASRYSCALGPSYPRRTRWRRCWGSSISSTAGCSFVRPDPKPWGACMRHADIHHQSHASRGN